MKKLVLSFLTLLIFLSSLISFIKSIESTSGEFEISHEEIYLNWTNNYEENLTITSNFIIRVVFDNSSLLKAKYSQGSNIPLIVKNNSGELTNENSVDESNSANFTLKPHIEGNVAGKYEETFIIFNSTNSSENTSVKVILDLPIEINTSWFGEFNGSMPSESKEYHSFYFLPLPNTTSITLNLKFEEGDLDLFLLANNTLLAKSINKDEKEEKLSYSFINQNLTYEIRIYGNFSSNIPYNGSVALNPLTSSLKKIDFGSQNVSNKTLTKDFTLINLGNISIEDVEEKFEIYYVKEFMGNGKANFTFFLPGSSLFEKIKVRLIWNGTGSYNFSLFNSSEEVCNSSKKHLSANVVNVEKEEFVEVNNSEKSSLWRIEVKNESVNISQYYVIVQAFVNASNWISTNFSNYENKSFDVVGSGNESKGIQLNLTTPPNAISGKYKGLIIYSSRNGELIIPLEFNLTNKLNISLAELKEEIINVSTQQGFVNATLLITYFNGEKISPQNFFNFSQNLSFELYEPNASYKLKINFTDISNETDWKFNLTIPMKIPGGKYYILAKLASELYSGQSFEDPSKQLIINDTGLFMNATYPSYLRNGTTGIINVTIKNFGPINATDAKIKLINESSITNIRFLSTNCQRKSTGEEVTFNISAFNSKGCYVAWEITASKEEGTAILYLRGTSGNWFRNLTIEIPIEEYYETTTTTTIPNITLPTTTSTTTTITTTTIPTTTTTTIPQKILLNETFKINSIEPNVPVVLSVSKQNTLKFQKIVIFTKKSLQNVSIVLREGEKPEGMAPPVKAEEGAVFKYLEILLEKISDEDLENVTIEFQVDKLWCIENDVHPSSISLYRYSKDWEKLPTVKLNETDVIYLFKSVSPGLSFFAIVGEKQKGLPISLTYLAIGGVVAGILAYLFWPTKEETKTEVKVEKTKEEDLRKPWEELKKKWEEFMKREKKSK